MLCESWWWNPPIPKKHWCSECYSLHFPKMDNSKQQLTIWNTVRSVSQHGQHGQQHLTTRTKQWLCHAMPVMPCDMPRATFLQLGFGMCENTFLSRRSPRTITDCRAGNIQGYIANQLNGFKCQMLTTWPKQWCYCKPSVLDQARSPVSVSWLCYFDHGWAPRLLVSIITPSRSQ